MAIFDVIGARAPDPDLWEQDIQTFRENTGTNALSYGVAYYPFLKTTAFPADQVSVANESGVWQAPANVAPISVSGLMRSGFFINTAYCYFYNIKNGII